MTTAACRGFVYATAVMGVTGARATTSDLAGPLVARAQGGHRHCRSAVGLGVSNGDQAAEVAAYADGVIVGSAFVRCLLDHDDTGRRRCAPGRADRGPRRGRTPCVGRSRLLAARARPGRSRCAACSKSSADAFAGAVLHRAVPRAGHRADRHRRQAVLAGQQHRQAAHPGLLRLHPLPRRVPDHDGHPGLGHAPARRRRPEQRPGRVRDHRPGPRHRPGDPRTGSTTSPRRSSGVTGPLADDQAGRHRRRRRRSRRDAGCPPAATTSPTAPRSSASTARTRCPVVWTLGTTAPRVRPRHPPAALLTTRGLPVTAAVHPQPVRGRLVPRPAARCAATPSASSPASSPRSGSASGAGSPAAARSGEVTDLALWAVPFGVIGGRLYHVITDHDLYFGAGKTPIERALRLARRPRHLGRDRARRPSASGSARGARASGCRRCSTRWRPASWSRRPWAAGATGSTRSCSASRPTCRGR